MNIFNIFCLETTTAMRVTAKTSNSFKNMLENIKKILNNYSTKNFTSTKANPKSTKTFKLD